MNGLKPVSGRKRRVVAVVSFFRADATAQEVDPAEVVLQYLDTLARFPSTRVVVGVRFDVMVTGGGCSSMRPEVRAMDPAALESFTVSSGYDVETWNGMQLCLALLAYYYQVVRSCPPVQLSRFRGVSPEELCSFLQSRVSESVGVVGYESWKNWLSPLPLKPLEDGEWSRALYVVRSSGCSGPAPVEISCLCELLDRKIRL